MGFPGSVGERKACSPGRQGEGKPRPYNTRWVFRSCIVRARLALAWDSGLHAFLSPTLPGKPIDPFRYRLHSGHDLFEYRLLFEVQHFTRNI